MFPLNERKRPAGALRRWAIAGAAVTAIANGCGTRSERAPSGSFGAPSSAGSGASTTSANAGHSPRPGGGVDPSGSGEGGRYGGAGAGDVAGGSGDAAGASEGGAAQAAGAPGSGVAGSGESGAPGGAEPVPIPICSRPLRVGEGRLLALSTPDDDLLQGITPDGLTLVFAAGGHFYLADRASGAEDFAAAVEVAGGLGFSSVTLSSDGLRLIGASASGFAELERPARGEAFSNEPNDADFAAFNAAVNGTPTDEIALEPLLALDDSLLVYSFVSASNEGSRPTLFASEWLGQWSFGQPLLGVERLWASGQARRVATGVSSDGLTLFYRDQVAGEFRSAWRRRLGDEFDAFQSLGELERAQPNGACSELYYSAQAEGGLELFVASAR